MTVEIGGIVTEVIRDHTGNGVALGTSIIEVIRDVTGEAFQVNGVVIEVIRDPSASLPEGTPTPLPTPPDPGTPRPPYPDQGTPDPGTPLYPPPEGLPNEPDEGVSVRKQGQWVPGAVVTWQGIDGWVPARIAKREDGQWVNKPD